MGELINKLNEYSGSDAYAFHMPGHKRNIDFELNPYRTDITEIEGFDDLHKPEQILYRLKNKIAKIYGADEAYILLNGSTSGIQTAISGITEYGEHILIARNSHKSVYNTVMLRGLKTSYIYPQTDSETGINKSVNPEEVDKILAEQNDIKGVVITSPTYEGVVSDIRAIAEIVHKYNIPLVVDAAHGAHLGFNDFFPENPIKCGADIVIMSLHKTLPSLTQTAVMCVQGNIADRNRIDRYYHAFLSSSPSYFLMASVEKCMDYLESTDIFNEYADKLRVFYSECNLKKLKFYKSDDPGKIVVSTAKCNLSGIELKEILREKYSLEMEMASEDYVIAMTSVCDTKCGFERLCRALKEIDDSLDFAKKTTDYHTVIPQIKMGIYEAENQAGKVVCLKDSIDKTSCEFIFAYPPGIPIIVPGEVFTQDVINLIKKNIKSGINIYGVTDKICVSICDTEGK